MQTLFKATSHSRIKNKDVGDWTEKLHVKTHNELAHKEQLLVGFHELIEAILCVDRNISEQSVSDWDKKGGCGDDKGAPYHKEHVFATKLEKMLAKELNVNWKEYEKHIERLCI